MGAITDDYLDERIEKTKTMIAAYEDAILALAGGAMSYTLDTGQTRTVVAKAQLGSMRSTLGHLETRLATLDARRNGAAVQVRPGF